MQTKLRGTILWLAGWGLPLTVFNPLRHLLPDFQHIDVDYSAIPSSEALLQLTEKAAKEAMSLNSGPLIIGGWSLGGLLALRLAAQGLADGLLLLASTAKFTRPIEQNNLGWADRYVRRMIAGLGANPQQTEWKFRSLAFTDEESALCPPVGSWTTPALIAGLEVLRHVECLSLLPEIGQPALVVHGTGDAVCPYAAAEELYARLPRADLLAIPGSGHAPFLGREAFLAGSFRSWWNEQ
jgi:Predicted hydrolases or acyltransferases (alpha/beta hydrolase superfamily)